MDMIAQKLKNNWGPEAPRTECSQLFEARYVKASHFDMDAFTGKSCVGQVGPYIRIAVHNPYATCENLVDLAEAPSGGRCNCSFTRRRRIRRKRASVKKKRERE